MGKGNDEVDIAMNARTIIVKITPEGIHFDTEDPKAAILDEEEIQGTVPPAICLLTVAEVAERLGVSDTTIRQAIRNREITHYRIGIGRGTIRINESDAIEWFEGY